MASGSQDIDSGQFQGFCSPFSVITKSILKIDPPGIPKQLLSWSLQLLDNLLPSSTGLWGF